MAKATNVRVYQDVNGELVASWSWNAGNTAGYDIQWWYHTAESIRRGGSPFLQTESTISGSTPTCRTDIPDHAYVVWFYVKPVAETDGSDNPLWTAEWSDYTGSAAFYNADVPAPLSAGKATNVRVYQDTNGELVGTWFWNKTYTESYLVRWWYNTKASVANGSSPFCAESTLEGVAIDTSARISRFSIPEGAQRIWFHVKPLAETHSVNGTEVARWTADWSTYTEDAVFYVNEAVKPNAPPVPSVATEGYRLTMELDNLDPGGDQIQFQVARNNTVSKNATVNIKLGHAAYAYTILAGSIYKVRARCYNRTADLYSEWSNWSGDCTTVPARPAGITTCRAASTTSVYLVWSGVSSAESYDLEYAAKGSYFDGSDATTVVSGITGTRYEKTGLETGQTYYFRVRAVNQNGASAWTAVKSTALGTTPAAPTTWASATTAVTGESVVLYWVHNCEDGSGQTAAELQLTVNDKTETVSFGSGSEIGSYTLKTSGYTEDTEIYWKVRTKGNTNTFGPWSVQRSIDVYAPPVLELNLKDAGGDPVTTMTCFPLYVLGTAGPASQTPIGYQVTVTTDAAYETTDAIGQRKVIKKGDAVYSRYMDTNKPLELALTPGDMDLENNVRYTVTVEATMDSGLTAADKAAFTVAWTDVLYQPDVEIGVNRDTLEAYIRPYVDYEASWLTDSMGRDILDSDGNRIETDRYAAGLTLGVYRREFDGGFTEIVSGLPNGRNTFVTDPHPALDYARYRVVATDNLTGAVSYYDPPAYPVGEKAIVLQWDERWSSFDGGGTDSLAEPAWTGSMLRLPYNIDVSDSHTPDVSLVRYIGRKDPVSYYGTQRGSEAVWRMDIRKDDTESFYAIRRLAAWMGNVYAREPSGSGYWASISVSFEQKHMELIVPVTVQLTRVEGGV